MKWLRNLSVITVVLVGSFTLVLVNQEKPLENIRAMATTLSPWLANEKSEFKIAVQLRNQIYKDGIEPGPGIPLLTSPELAKWDEAYRKSFFTKTRANSCNGLAILYMLALRSFDIKSRMVAMYGDTIALIMVSSHASVDVLVDGKWMAMDPTFNLSLNNAMNEKISWREAIQRYRSGKIVIQTRDGEKYINARLENYFKVYMQSNFKSVSKYAFLGPYDGGEPESLNPSWDGKISYSDGSQYDAWSSVGQEFYRSIARGWKGY